MTSFYDIGVQYRGRMPNQQDRWSAVEGALNSGSSLGQPVSVVLLDASDQPQTVTFEQDQ